MMMGFNDFCASAQNSKKRPRQTIYLAANHQSLKQATDELLGNANDSHSSDDERAHRRTGGGSANGTSNLPTSVGKSWSASGGADDEDDFVGDRDLLECGDDYTEEDELDHSYDQPPVDFTLVQPHKRRVSIAAHKEAEERNVRTMRSCLNLIRSLLADDEVSGALDDDDPGSGVPADIRAQLQRQVLAQLEQDEFKSHCAFAAAVRTVLEGAREHAKARGLPSEGLQLFAESFEDKYHVVADQAQHEEEEATRRFLPRPLPEMPQRRLDNWCIIDDKGIYLAPWHGAHACAPGVSVCVCACKRAHGCAGVRACVRVRVFTCSPYHELEGTPNTNPFATNPNRTRRGLWDPGCATETAAWRQEIRRRRHTQRG